MLEIFQAGYHIWNGMMDTVMTLFTTDPLLSPGAGMMQNLSGTVINLATPICCIFFLIAIIRDVISVPPEHQVRTFMQQAIKFAVIIAIMSNLWVIMSAISSVCTNVAGSFGAEIGTAYRIDLTEGGDLKTALDAFEAEGWWGPNGFSIFNLGECFAAMFAHLGTYILIFIMGLATLFVCIACALSVLISAWKRLIQPLLLLPFTSIAIATGAGSPESARSMMSFIKTFISFCLSGAMMVSIVYLAAVLSQNGIISMSGLDVQLGTNVTLILAAFQQSLLPIVTAGLIRGAESLMQRALGLY